MTAHATASQRYAKGFAMVSKKKKKNSLSKSDCTALAITKGISQREKLKNPK